MSNAAIHWAWKQTTGDPTGKLVLQVLADLADESHSCFPSPEHIAGKIEASKSTVLRYLRKLEGLSLIRRERRYANFGGRVSDRFVLDVDGQISAIRELQANLNSGEKLDGKPQVTPLGANLACNGEVNEKPLITSLEANLASNDESVSPLEVNCGLHIDTPQEIKDKSLIIEQSAAAREAGARPDRDTDFHEIDSQLQTIHPSLSVAAIAEKLKVADVHEVDVLGAAQTILGRASRKVSYPVPFVAKAIDKSPDAWRPQLPGFEPGQDVSGRVSDGVRAREQQRQRKAACTANNHDWGPSIWDELSRSHCVDCGAVRRDFDEAFREMADERERWIFTEGGDS